VLDPFHLIHDNVTNFLTTLSGHTNTVKAFAFKTSRLVKPVSFKVLDSVHEDGVKLVKIDPEKISDIQMAFPGVRVVREVFFNKAVIPKQKIAPGIKKLTVGKSIKITLVSEADEKVAGAQVIAFTDFQNGVGAQGTTNASGHTTLKFPISTKAIQRLYVYPKHTYWPLLRKNLKLGAGGVDVSLTLIDPAYADAVHYFYNNATLPKINQTIKVGVIDTGVGTHRHINLVGGECTVEGENNNDITDYDGHGTHVAGIVSSFSRKINNSPGIEILSYRVFPKRGGGASNYSIVKAIDRAIASGCHLINMSLGGGDPDDATKDAIAEAHSKGVICFVATGNDDRGEVCFPANFSLSLAVSAMGRKGTFPPHAEAADSVVAPYGKDKKNFVASFSNIGNQVDMIAPGVGIVSCAPDNKFAVMSGTSMACPAATGIVARLLMEEGTIINLLPNSHRSNSMIKFFGSKMKSLGFKTRYEGKGMVFR